MKWIPFAYNIDTALNKYADAAMAAVHVVFKSTHNYTVLRNVLVHILMKFASSISNWRGRILRFEKLSTCIFNLQCLYGLHWTEINPKKPIANFQRDFDFILSLQLFD